MRDQSENVMYRLLLSRAITDLSLNLIPYVEVKISRRCANPSSKPFIMYKELNVRRVTTWFKCAKVMKTRPNVE